MKTTINLVIKPKKMLTEGDLIREIHKYLRLSDEETIVDTIKVSKKFLNKGVSKNMWTMTGIGPYTFKIIEEKHNLVVHNMN